jgi:hypothetical protein
MDYQKIMDTTGIYSIQEHLMAMKSGFKCSRLSNSLKENVLELKWNRNADAQKLVYQLLETIEESDTIENKEKIDKLLQIINADKVIKNTPHTFHELWEKEEEEEEEDIF